MQKGDDVTKIINLVLGTEEDVWKNADANEKVEMSLEILDFENFEKYEALKDDPNFQRIVDSYSGLLSSDIPEIMDTVNSMKEEGRLEFKEGDKIELEKHYSFSNFLNDVSFGYLGSDEQKYTLHLNKTALNDPINAIRAIVHEGSHLLDYETWHADAVEQYGEAKANGASELRARYNEMVLYDVTGGYYNDESIASKKYYDDLYSMWQNNDQWRKQLPGFVEKQDPDQYADKDRYDYDWNVYDEYFPKNNSMQKGQPDMKNSAMKNQSISSNLSNRYPHTNSKNLRSMREISPMDSPYQYSIDF